MKTLNIGEKKKKTLVGFPGGSVVKNLPDNAGSTGSIPDPGRSHMPWTYWACTSQLPKPACLRACAPQEKPPQWAAWIPQLANSPQLSTTREKPAKDPAQPKTKKKTKKQKNIVILLHTHYIGKKRLLTPMLARWWKTRTHMFLMGI